MHFPFTWQDRGNSALCAFNNVVALEASRVGYKQVNIPISGEPGVPRGRTNKVNTSPIFAQNGFKAADLL